jgi:hypothetical protein
VPEFGVPLGNLNYGDDYYEYEKPNL